MAIGGVTWQARPTTYRGIQMRSRLEAKFAAVLDRLETVTRWEYEPRAFANQHGQYLPDFVVYDGPLPALYIEVKPTIELALAVLPRMQIIWDSEPDATLWCDTPLGMYVASPGGPWRWTPFA